MEGSDVTPLAVVYRNACAVRQKAWIDQLFVYWNLNLLPRLINQPAGAYDDTQRLCRPTHQPPKRMPRRCQADSAPLDTLLVSL